MEFVWNRELKRFALLLGSIFLCSIICVNLFLGCYGNYIRREYNRFLTAVLGNIVTYYPEVQEDKLIEVLNQHTAESFEMGADILAQYGVYQNCGSESFEIQEKGIRFLYFGGTIFVTVIFAVIFYLFFRYFMVRQKKISELKNYMEALNYNNYILKIKDNADDELSGLRNEIYKLTVYLKEQAKRAQEQRQVLANSMADISHQLKTPLTSVTILTNNMCENMEMDMLTKQRFLSEMTRQLSEMSWLITAILKLSRVDAGVVEFERKFCKIRTIMEESIKKVEIAAEWNNIAIITDIPETAGLYIDKKWTVEAMMNIVKNAIEHSSPGSSVEIVGEVNDVYIQIMICDHGKGISKEEREKLFQRFYNGNGAREDSTGIGLSLAKEIIEKQGGTITVDSKIGKGTIFKIRFMRMLNKI